MRMSASVGVSVDEKRVAVGDDELWGSMDLMVEKKGCQMSKMTGDVMGKRYELVLLCWWFLFTIEAWFGWGDYIG